jgi:competence protein ComEA
MKLKKGLLSLLVLFSFFSAVVIASDTININTADEIELQSLNGVGSSTAKAIIEYRQINGPFNSASELVNVKGVGQKKIDKLIELISVE